MKSRAFVRARALKLPDGLALAIGAALLALIALPDAHAALESDGARARADVADCVQAAKPYYGLRDTLAMAQGVLLAAGE